MSDEQQVFGLNVGWVLNDDETPIEVLGVVKYLDADGRPDYTVFQSESIANVECLGMSEWLRLRTKADAESYMYVQATAFGLDDDDDD